MIPTRQAILEQALQLPTNELARLAQDLWDAVEEPIMDPEVEAEWREEIARRVDAHDRGETRAVDAEEMFARIERQLETMRSARRVAG